MGDRPRVPPAPNHHHTQGTSPWCVASNMQWNPDGPSFIMTRSY